MSGRQGDKYVDVVNKLIIEQKVAFLVKFSIQLALGNDLKFRGKRKIDKE